MKFRHLLPLLTAGALLSCDSSGSGDEQAASPEDGSPAPAAAPTAEARAALESQKIGKALLGNTVRLVGDSFTPADPPFAAEAYFVYYSASW